MLKWPIVFLDLPLSFVADTVLLPYTAIHDLSGKRSGKSSEIKDHAEPTSAGDDATRAAPKK